MSATDALPASQHAIGLYRQLAGISPGRFQPELANSLTNLGTLLSDLGHPAEALTRSQAAPA